MTTQYSEEFKKDAVRYWEEHQELGVNACTKNLGISKSALSAWRKKYQMNKGNIPTRGRDNYESDEAKENARMRREIKRCTGCTWNIKKSYRHTGKLAEAIYLGTSKKDHKIRNKGGRWLNVSGVLGYLGVSRSGYNSWKNRIPSNREQRKNNIKNKICDIYGESHQNYGVPKIIAILNKNGEITSEKTVENYMREMGMNYPAASEGGLSSKMCKFLIFPYRQFSKLPILYTRINTVHTSECVPAFCRP